MKKDKEENPNEPENGELEHKVSMADQFIYDTASLYSTINPTQFCFRKQQYRMLFNNYPSKYNVIQH